jgi:hypothetical protein
VSMKSVGVRLGTPPDTGTPFGINLGAGASAVLAAVLIAAMIPATAQWWRFAVVMAVVGVFGALSRDARALAGVAVIAWLLVDGFLENRLGNLSWHGASDLALVLLVASAGAAGLLLGASHRHLRELRSRSRVDIELRVLLTHFIQREKHDA